jgi:hypothetical protein
MKRRISLVIAFALAFLMMFSSIARAEETEVPISVPQSESADLEITIKVPFAEVKKAILEQVFEEAEPMSKQEEKEPTKKQCNQCRTPNDVPGICVQIGTNPCGYCKLCGSRQ